MTAVEVAANLDRALVGSLSTLRADGHPVTLPMWFVVLDEHVHVRTRSVAVKARRMRRDPRVCFTVEQGEAWPDLAAVVIVGRAVELEGAPARRVEDAMAVRYHDLGVPGAASAATHRHYDTGSAYFEIVPDHDPLTWDNHKLMEER